MATSYNNNNVVSQHQWNYSTNKWDREPIDKETETVCTNNKLKFTIICHTPVNAENVEFCKQCKHYEPFAASRRVSERIESRLTRIDRERRDAADAHDLAVRTAMDSVRRERERRNRQVWRDHDLHEMVRREREQRELRQPRERIRP